MISIRTLGHTWIPGEQRSSFFEGIVVLLCGAAVAAFILVPMAGFAVAIGCVAVWFVALICRVFRGRFEELLLLWSGAFPLGYYFASFPREQPFVTLDRVVILVTFTALILAKPHRLATIPKAMRQAGLVWMAFLAVACVSLGRSTNALNAAKNLLDSFVLPLLLGWCVIARFDVRGRLSAIHTGVCISSFICAAVGAGEIITGQDLLPFGGSTAFFAGGIVRPNGPFEGNDTLALVGAASVFFLLFLRANLDRKLSVGRRTTHFIGVASALGMALMPMFRSVVITLLLALIIDTFWEHGTIRRAQRVALIIGLVALALIPAVLAPDVFEDRSSSDNLYGRVAQLQQSFRVFVEHPLLGVGFLNFHEFVSGDFHYRMSYAGVLSLDWPHDNLAQVLTENGLLGFVPYVLAHALLFKAMWELRKLSRPGNLAYKYYLYLFLTYWITGLTESSGYSPFNFWYIFAASVFYKYALAAPDSIQSAELHTATEAPSSRELIRAM
jgi:O-antigen ligase